MKLASITASALTIPFNVSFRHASAERTAMQSLWVEARADEGMTGYGEGCPREYVTAESVSGAQAFVHAHAAEWVASIRDVGTLFEWAAAHRTEIDANPAAWTAVEIALLDLFGKALAQPIEALLGCPPLSGRFRYTAVLGDASREAFAAQLAHYRNAGFTTFKVKLSGDPARDLEKTRTFVAAGIQPVDVRADANNLWRDADDAIAALEALHFPFFALEEPLASRDYAGMARIADALDTRIILDESLTRVEQLDRLGAAPARWIANVRISKMGGVVRSLGMVRALRARGMPLIVGAHVGESSVLTRAALTVANSGRDLLIAQEGAFGTHLLAHDVADRPLMFGAGGILDATAISAAAPGLGLTIARPQSARGAAPT